MSRRGEQEYRDGQPSLGSGDNVVNSPLGAWSAFVGILTTDSVRNALWRLDTILGTAATQRGKVAYVAEESKTVTLGTAFADTDYVVQCHADDNIVWHIDNQQVGQFDIKTSGQFTGTIYWEASKI